MRPFRTVQVTNVDLAEMERSDSGELEFARGTGTIVDLHRAVWNRPWTFDAMRS